MLLLYHVWLSPFCRKVRLVLAEKKLDFEMKVQKVWERDPSFLALNPTGEVPLLIDEDGTRVAGSQPICEYLDEMYGDVSLIGQGAVTRAEVRRLVEWFDRKFHDEVIVNLVDEKIIKRFLGQGEPNSRAILAGSRNLHTHLDYVDWLIDRRTWLAGEDMSLADLTAAAHLSCVDYLGDVPWDDHPAAKDWYARVKSRPCFRPILADRIPGAPPPPHYADLDF
ncbi:glutathione S-transferase family protein [Hwanghaeella sp.]|uniref:glutathione S-transferase family protein n=1 Tax=Hwanghaeella sp. TaxID=2605943 RepID=UPI003CCB98BC